MCLGDGDVARDIEAISSGSIGLDIALGIGGLPRGRIVEIYGPESSGNHPDPRSHRRLSALAAPPLLLTPNMRWIPFMPSKLALILMSCLFPSRTPASRRLEITDMLVRSGRGGYRCYRLRRGPNPKAEIEGEMGDSHMGLQARLMSQALRKLTAN